MDSKQHLISEETEKSEDSQARCASRWNVDGSSSFRSLCYSEKSSIVLSRKRCSDLSELNSDNIQKKLKENNTDCLQYSLEESNAGKCLVNKKSVEFESFFRKFISPLEDYTDNMTNILKNATGSKCKEKESEDSPVLSMLKTTNSIDKPNISDFPSIFNYFLSLPPRNSQIIHSQPGNLLPANTVTSIKHRCSHSSTSIFSQAICYTNNFDIEYSTMDVKQSIDPSSINNNTPSNKTSFMSHVKDLKNNITNSSVEVPLLCSDTLYRNIVSMGIEDDVHDVQSAPKNDSQLRAPLDVNNDNVTTSPIFSSSKNRTESYYNSTINIDSSLTNSHQHILKILADDIIITDGHRHLNNIRKIATKSWLLKAIASCAERSMPRKGNFLVLPMHTNNVFNPIVEITRSSKRLVTTKTSQRNCSDLDYMLGEIIDDRMADESFQNSEGIPCVNKEKLMLQINRIFGEAFDIFEQKPRLELEVWRVQQCNAYFVNNRLQLKPWSEVSPGYIKNVKCICLIFYFLAKLYVLLEDNKITTQRELYYQCDKITSYGGVSRCLRSVTCLLNVGLWHLNIASTMGSISGNLTFIYTSGERKICKPQVLVPPNLDDIVGIETDATFILVVEKEAIYTKLVNEDLSKKIPRPFILISGKGSPSFATRAFLRKLAYTTLLPVFILVDADVYGIKIMMSYRYGVLATAHLSQFLVVPNAKWLGVYPTEISQFGITSKPISPCEERLLDNLCNSIIVVNNVKLRKELEFMRTSGRKASIEDIIKNETFLSDQYLRTKLLNSEFI